MNLYLHGALWLGGSLLVVLFAPHWIAKIRPRRRLDVRDPDALRLPPWLEHSSVVGTCWLSGATFCAIVCSDAATWFWSVMGPFAAVRHDVLAAPAIVPVALLVLAVIALHPLYPCLPTALLSTAASGFWFLIGLGITHIGV